MLEVHGYEYIFLCISLNPVKQGCQNTLEAHLPFQSVNRPFCMINVASPSPFRIITYNLTDFFLLLRFCNECDSVLRIYVNYMFVSKRRPMIIWTALCILR